MEDLKIYGLNIAALAFSLSEINPVLQTISLLLAIVYTAIQIVKRMKKEKV
tara:strand:+ start:694 stop:846 length:153 start_codon:yes stop_codon:yes gene_type:complete